MSAGAGASEPAGGRVPSRWERNAERGTVGALRLAVFLQRAFGRRLSRGMILPVALYFWLSDPAGRRASRLYLETLWSTAEGRAALGRPPGPLATLHHFYEFATNIYDRLLVWGPQLVLFGIRNGAVGLDRGQSGLDIRNRQAGHCFVRCQSALAADGCLSELRDRWNREQHGCDRKHDWRDETCYSVHCCGSRRVDSGSGLRWGNTLLHPLQRGNTDSDCTSLRTVHVHNQQNDSADEERK